MILIMFEGFDSDIEALTYNDLSSYHLNYSKGVTRDIIDCYYVNSNSVYYCGDGSKESIKLKLRDNNG